MAKGNKDGKPAAAKESKPVAAKESKPASTRARLREHYQKNVVPALTKALSKS